MADTFVPVEPTAYVAQQNQAGAKQLPDAGRDFEFAQRGLVAAADSGVVFSRKGEDVVWRFDAFDFLQEEAPGAVAPSVWRKGQLDSVSAGLYYVADGLYQVRGYDLADMTIVVGGDGLVVIDPLGSYETARDALALFRRGTENSKPVRAVVHTQSGVDHFGGVRGLFAEVRDVVPGDLKVYAPDGFLADAVLRQVTEGARNAKLVDYAYGTRLGHPNPHGLVDSDLGRTVSLGEATFLVPTDTVGGVLSPSTPKDTWPSWAGVAWRDGLYAVEVAGVKLVLQPATGHASPAELNLYLPEFKAVHLAGAGLLGAPGKGRADLLNATTAAFGTTAEIGFGAYGWPVWGKEQVSTWLAGRRTAATAVPDAGAVAPLLATPGYLDTPARTVREVWSKLYGTALGAPQLAATAKAGLLLPGSAGKQVDAAQRAYDDAVPDYAKAVLLLDPVISAASIPLAVPAATEKQARALQSKALTQLGYLAPNARLRNALLTAARDVLDPGSAVTRFTQAVADLASYANPLK
ncbi:alkyl sulfatase dimerization domain-containing protein [Kitasatospora sp. NPDC058444]|uniref:alkyl sulfatase dimerization domain-containing protein n=1 Tax=Kitasatospora sp. NPDC058444 TaxID=3346504 RepID=UPI00365F8F63